MLCNLRPGTKPVSLNETNGAINGNKNNASSLFYVTLIKLLLMKQDTADTKQSESKTGDRISCKKNRLECLEICS